MNIFTVVHVVISLIAIASGFVVVAQMLSAKLSKGWTVALALCRRVGPGLSLNFFVLIVQSFQKILALKTLAPTRSEPPFGIAQGIALLLFIVLPCST